MTNKELEKGLAGAIRCVELESRLNGHEYLDGSRALAKASLAYLREQGILTTNDKE